MVLSAHLALELNIHRVKESVLLGYAAVMIAMITVVGILSSRRSAGRLPADYFLGSRSLGGISVGASLFATNLLGLMLLAELGGRNIGTGLTYGILAIFFALTLGLALGPLYRTAGVITVPQFFSVRFHGSTGIAFAIIAVLFSIAVRLPLLLAFALWVMEALLGWSVMTSTGLIIIVVSVGLYTIMGGFSSVVRTHMLESAVALAGVFIIGVSLMTSGEATVSSRAPLLSPDVPLTLLPGVLMVFAWQWWADQFTVQRILAASGIVQAKRGVLIYAMLMAALLLGFFAVAGLKGMSPVVYALSADSWHKVLLGMVFLGLLMATLAAEFLSTATLMTNDLVKWLYPDATDESLVLTGRLSTTAIVGVAILQVSTVPLVDGSFFGLLQQVQAHIAPPVVAVLLFGVLWQRMTATGALIAFLAGELFGIGDLVVRYLLGIKTIVAGSLYEWGTMSVFAFGGISFVLTSIVIVAISLVTQVSRDPVYLLDLARKKQG